MSQSDEWETPFALFDFICEKTGITPKIDVCATRENRKCGTFYSMSTNGLEQEWFADVWCNPPHSLTGKFVEKADYEYQKRNINILMIIPANTVSSEYFHKYIYEKGRAFFPIRGRIRFYNNGKPSQHISRNAYLGIVWKKK